MENMLCNIYLLGSPLFSVTLPFTGIRFKGMQYIPPSDIPSA